MPKTRLRNARMPAALLAGLALLVCELGAAAPRIEGFAAPSALRQLALERRFDADLSAEDLRAWMQRMSSAPNQVGADHDRRNAEFVRDQFRAWGWEADIETFSILYPTPRRVALALLAPGHYTAKLREPPIAGDATSAQVRAELPPYNVFGADGDVTGELVYVNHGMPADYTELARYGVDVRGKIVIARYGDGWRGLKPKLAYEHGAIGCIIYSDPRDDGYGAGDAYPRGGYRPADAVQRGSVQDMVVYPGDPLTPGVGSTAAAQRLPIRDAKTILKIPVLPISYADAQPLLAAIEGPLAPPSWRGGLPITYHLGAGPAKVRLQIESEWGQKTIYDVIAKIRGSEAPEQWVIRGNHHDAWVFGAMDPLSGHGAMMAEARSIGRLLKSGWRPKRTLVYASWDAEEPGLIGSTEWAETHAQELAKAAVLYINSDTNGRGVLSAEGSQGLRHFVSEAAAEVQDPETGASLTRRARAFSRAQAFDRGAKPDSADSELELGAMGSGSDFTPFIQHLGVAALNLEFSGESDYGVYHSAYDSYDHFRRFVDPTFGYGVALARVAGRLVLRAAQSDLLPFRAKDFSDAVAGYVRELHELSDAQRSKAEQWRELAADDTFNLARNPARPLAPPEPPGEVPHLELAALDNAAERLKIRAAAFDEAYDRLLESGAPESQDGRVRCNAVLANLEASLTDARGLPGRPWFAHMIYAPGFHTGYGVKTLPGVREAIEERRWDEANRYAGIVANVLDAYSSKFEQAFASP